jgi:hypothetical protein
MSPNVTCSVSLESYHQYLQPQKVSKIQKFSAFIAACPKSLNSIYGTHRPLGVKRFLKLAHTFGSVKCSNLHGHSRFHFFLILFFLNLEYTWTFISIVGIFVSWKFEITKYSSRFASVMEIFCTPLQCMVHLSMFHSSSTSKKFNRNLVDRPTICKNRKAMQSRFNVQILIRSKDHSLEIAFSKNNQICN